MFGNWRWLHKLIAVFLVAFGMGLLLATLLEWGWFMILLAIIFMVIGIFWTFCNC